MVASIPDFAALRRHALARPLTNLSRQPLDSHARDLPGGFRVIVTANH